MARGTIYMYMYMCIYTVCGMHTYAHVRILHTVHWLYMCICMHTNTVRWLAVHVHVHMYAYHILCICTSTCTCTLWYEYVVCIHMHVVCICGMHTYAHVHVYMYAYHILCAGCHEFTHGPARTSCVMSVKSCQPVHSMWYAYIYMHMYMYMVPPNHVYPRRAMCTYTQYLCVSLLHLFFSAFFY